MGRWYRQGVATVLSGSAQVVGDGTIWDTQVKAGDPFRMDSHPDRWIEVASIEDGLNLTLAEPWPFGDQVEGGYAVVRNFAGTPNADLAADLAGVIRKYADLNTEIGNWLIGTATGGPNDDGFYPITINGTTRLVPSPALILPPSTPEERVARGIYNRVDHNPAGTDVTLDLGAGSVFDLNLDAPSCLVALSNKPTRPGTAYHATLVLKQATGGNLVDWSAIPNLKWNGGVVPILSGLQFAIDVVDLLTIDGGNNWFGFYSGQGIV